MNCSITEQLPEPILHQILARLPQKDAVRTCVLSKSWRHLWYARPQINFCRTDFEGICRCSPKTPKCRFCLQEQKNTFRSALLKTLQRYHYQKLSVENIELKLFVVDSQWISLLEMWIPLLLIPNMSLKTFILHFNRRSLSYFNLPSIVFQVKSLEKLCLKKCRVNQFNGKVLLECLQTISLKKVFIEVDTFEMLMSSCPLIENVDLEECDGLSGNKVIRVKHNNLKHFTFSAYVETKDDDSPIIEIDTPNLISLSLEEVQLHTNYFKNLSSNFPCLEDLSIFGCKGLGELKLSSRSIKHLALSVLKGSIKATIDAPNLSGFCFSGQFPQTSFITFTKTSSEWKSLVPFFCAEGLYDDDDDLSRLRDLGVLLRALSTSQISLDVCYGNLQPNQHIEEEGGFYLEPVVVENLRFDNAISSPSLPHSPGPHFLDGLFRLCRPRYTQTLHNDSQLFDFLCKVLVQEREKRDYFWQKDLDEVDLEVWDKETNEWKQTSLPDCQLPSKENIRFRLKWSDK